MNLTENAKYFSRLSREARKVAKAYRKAAHKENALKKSICSTIHAHEKANLLAEEVLGGRIISTEASAEESTVVIPEVVTDSKARAAQWSDWFASVQAEIDSEESNDTNNENN